MGGYIHIFRYIMTGPVWKKTEIIESISCQLSSFFSEKGINDSTITFGVAKTKSKQKRPNKAADSIRGHPELLDGRLRGQIVTI